MRKKTLLILVLSMVAIGVITYGQLQNRQQQKVHTEIARAETQRIADEKAKEEEAMHQLKIKGEGHTIRYFALGDSLTEGYYATSYDNTFVQLIGNKLRDRMSFDVDIEQHGLAGSKLAWGLGEVSKINEAEPDLVTIEFGTNDADPKKNPTDLELFESHLNELIDGITVDVDRNPAIVLVTTWRMSEYGVPYDNIIKKVAKERNIPVAAVNAASMDNLNVGPEGRDTYLGKSDIYHPNDRGMEQISEIIYEQVEPLMVKFVDDKKNN